MIPTRGTLKEWCVRWACFMRKEWNRAPVDETERAERVDSGECSWKSLLASKSTRLRDVLEPGTSELAQTHSGQDEF